jgi:hypothetical protein
MDQPAAPEKLSVAAPLRHLALAASFRGAQFGPGLSLLWMSPATRRLMLDAAHAVKARSDVLDCVLHSECVAFIDVPTPTPVPSSPLIAAAIYRAIADRIVHRLTDCLRLFADVPPPSQRLCWFLIQGERPDAMCATAVDPNWEDDDADDGADPLETLMGLGGLERYWTKLAFWCEIDQLNNTFTDPAKQQGYVAAAKHEVRERAEDLIQTMHGERASVDNAAEDGPSQIDLRTRSGAWWVDGYARAFRAQLGKLDRKRYAERSGGRFTRALQIFFDTFRLHEPHRFLARVGVLECLLSVGLGELGMQLAVRIAWLLVPEPHATRQELHQTVKDLYLLRSKIAHGADFSAADLERKAPELLALVRRVLNAVLSNDATYAALMANSADDYLIKLLLGGV